jgi:tRNA(adenine34) deaminase
MNCHKICIFHEIQHTMNLLTDDYFMQLALKEAMNARDKQEIPVGAVITAQGQVLAKAHNQTETLQDVTAHAEILAITAAENNLGAKYLQECTLYVTIEPCAMCAGAIAWSQLARLVYAAPDLKRGYSRFQPSLLHPKTEVKHGLRANEAAALMQQFFENKRD